MEASLFNKADHTIVLSDVHLTDAEPAHPKRPLWKRYKRRKLFIDKSFKIFLEELTKQMIGRTELVLNGDIFDFDSVTTIPENPSFPVSWIEQKRGLFAEEEKSRFKLSVIMEDHVVWCEALRDYILKGNRVVFIVGNHDVELQWPSVQEDFIHRMGIPEELRSCIVFCEWFYISNQDTLIEHSNQYDAYCVRPNPVHPLVRRGSKIMVRLPFGNLACRFLTNGMGLINPHVDTNFIMSLRQYIVFFYKYMMRTQPLIPWTWLWSSLMTLFYSVSEGLLPSLKDPLTVETRIEEIAQKSNATPYIVRALFELHVHPATFNPIKIMKELWLDRALLLFLIFLGSFQFFSFIHVFIQVSFWWFFIPFFATLPIFVFYARSVKSDVMAVQEAAIEAAPLAAQIARVKRVVHGHTHRERFFNYNGVEIINTGTWSPAYEDVECTKPYGRKCFAWIHPSPSGAGRIAELYEWKEPVIAPLPQEPHSQPIPV